MTRPTVLMEMYLAGAWVDITAYVHLPSGISVTRGRDNEQGSPNPGTLSFTVKTDGGRFIVGNSAAPAPFNSFARWAPVRYSINGVRRFTGFVSSAPASWRSSKLSQVPIVCTDLLGMMAMSPTVRSWTAELIAEMSPLHWWTLADAGPHAQPTAGGEQLLQTTNGQISGPDPITADPTDTCTFGQAGGSETDTQVQFKINRDSQGESWSRASANLSCFLMAGLPAEFTVLLVYTPTEAQTGREPIWSIEQAVGGIYITAARDGADLVFMQGATEKLRESNYFYAPFPRQTLIAVHVTATKVRLVNTGHEYSRTLGGLGGARFLLGESEGMYSQAVICDGLVADNEVFDLERRIFGRTPSGVTDWLTRATDEAGTSTVVTATTDRLMLRPQLKGSNPAAIAETLASAAGAMCVADRNGSLAWIDLTWCPAHVDLVEPLTTDAKWDADASLYYTDVQVDGATVATSPTNTFPKRSREVSDRLPYADRMSFVAWLANTADIWAAPRASGLVVNLWPLSAARVAAYLGLDLRSRVRLTTLPEGMPTPMIATVEGYTETVTESAWVMTIATAPDPSLVWEDDITTWESDYRINPF